MVVHGVCQNLECLSKSKPHRTRRRDAAGVFRCDAPVPLAVRGIAKKRAEKRHAQQTREELRAEAARRAHAVAGKLVQQAKHVPRRRFRAKVNPLVVVEQAERLLHTPPRSKQVQDSDFTRLPRSMFAPPRRNGRGTGVAGTALAPGFSSSSACSALVAGLPSSSALAAGCSAPWEGVPGCGDFHRRLARLCRVVVSKLEKNKECRRPEAYQVLQILSTSCKLFTRAGNCTQPPDDMAAAFLSLGAKMEGLFEGFVFAAVVSVSGLTAASLAKTEASIATKLGSKCSSYIQYAGSSSVGVGIFLNEFECF